MGFLVPLMGVFSIRYSRCQPRLGFSGTAAMSPTIFSGFRLALTYILKSVLGLEYVAQVGGVGMWLSDAAFKFEVEEVYAGLFGTMLLSILFLYLINRSEVLVRR